MIQEHGHRVLLGCFFHSSYTHFPPSGTKQGTVKCLNDITGKEMAGSFCSGNRPNASSISCSMPACPSHRWRASYGVCQFDHGMLFSIIIIIKLIPLFKRESIADGL